MSTDGTQQKQAREIPMGVNEDPNDVPRCDCGYSKSDWMIDHWDGCAYVRHGKFHNLERELFHVMGNPND